GRDGVPPSTAERSSFAARIRFPSGCCAVNETPAVCVWKRISHERGSRAPYFSFICRAQIRRAARYFAISSKKSRCALKKKESRGAKASTSSPRSMHASTYANPSASVNASSCAAFAPAPRRWCCGDLLRRVRPGPGDVVARDRDRVHERQPLRAPLDHVHDEPHRR